MSGDEALAAQDAGVVHCEHGKRCGGCTLLGVPEREQLQMKRDSALFALARYPTLSALPVAPVVAARPSIGYRTRAKLVVSRAGDIGLYARGSHDVIDIPHCRVLGKQLAATVDAIRALVRRRPLGLSGIDLREVRDLDGARVMVTLAGAPQARAALESLAHELAKLTAVAGVALSARDPQSPAFFGEAPQVVSGPAAFRDRLIEGGPYHLASHGSFVQAHRTQSAAIALQLLDSLERALGTLSGARVLELYAGSGALGLGLCQRGARPLLVERFAPALAFAKQAADAQGLVGLDTREGDAETIVQRLVGAHERFDAVIVNPPRRGLPVALREGLVELSPRALAYVSCDPETLARDLSHLALLGYACHRLAPFDLMPLTSAVEILALLLPATPPPIEVLHEDDELIAVDKVAHIPTTPQGDGPRSLLQRVREERGLSDLVPVHRLDIGTSGVCLLAKSKTAVAALSRALKSGDKQYLALVRGITRDKGSVRRPLRDGDKRREARTRYARIEVLGGHSLLRARPDEGRTHQIRRHLAAIGHPVLGDARHGDPASNRHFEQKHGLDRTFLHLDRIALLHPKTGASLVLRSRLPGDLASICDRLRREHTKR